MSIRSIFTVATAIATLGLGSPAFAATCGGYSNDTGNMMPSYYDKNGWHTAAGRHTAACKAWPRAVPIRTRR